MDDCYVERNYDDDSIYYQIDILMSAKTLANTERITEVICKYCDLPKGYSAKNVKARLLLCYEQDKPIIIDCHDDFEIYSDFFSQIKDYCPTFSRDYYFKRKEPTYYAKRR